MKEIAESSTRLTMVCRLSDECPSRSDDLETTLDEVQQQVRDWENCLMSDGLDGLEKDAMIDGTHERNGGSVD